MRLSASTWRAVGANVALGLGYFVASQSGWDATTGACGRMPVWLPTGVALGGVVLGGWRLWPGLLTGVLATVLLAGASLPLAAVMAVVATGQALLGWWLVKRLGMLQPDLGRVRDVGVLVGLGAALGTLLSPTLGTVAMVGLRHSDWVDAAQAGLRWWRADALGVLLAAPAVLTWGAGVAPPWRRREWVDAALTVVLLAACGVVVFHLEAANIYLMAPPLVWAALRLGQRGTAAASLAVGVWSVLATSRGAGPLASLQGLAAVSELQAFLTVMSLMSLLLAASILDRGRTSAALQEGNERFRALAESTPDVIMRFDRAHRHLYVSPAVEPQTGIPIAGFLGRTHEEMGFPSHLVELWAEAIERVFVSAQMVRLEFELPNGIWIDWVLAPELAADSSVSAVCAVARDISARKKAEAGLQAQQAELELEVARRTAELEAANAALREEFAQHEAAEGALRRSEERYRSLVETSPDGIFMADFDGHLVTANPPAARMHGYGTVEELVAGGRPVMDLVSGADRPRTMAAMARLRHEGFVGHVPLTLLRQDGSHFQGEVSVSLLCNSRGQGYGFVGVSRDISERQRAEDALRESQKMRVVGQLAGGIAHDFNNLLQALMGSVEALRLRGAETPARSRLVAEMAADIQRGAALTRQLLLFVRQEVTRLETLDLNQVVADTASLLRRLLRESISLGVETTPGVLAVVADRGQVEQVLMNLTVNASDAVLEGGVVTIRTGEGPALEAWIEVEDNGVGIRRELHERIFEPFYTTKEGAKGTGLGLAVVKSIALQHEGRVEVRSSVGVGSTFRFVLPRCGAPEDATLPTSDPIAPGSQCSGGHVLLVEDDPSAREGLRDMLSMLGYQVTAVGNGEEALAQGEGARFDLLLTDLLLPGMHGGELVRQARERWPAAAVIVMSGYAEDEAVRRGVTRGEVRFLQKPFGAALLDLEIRAALG